MGALAAAFELTRSPSWRARYEVTVLQTGWVLGGKGASTRNPDHGHRIEEHGFHTWGGYYDAAFRLMRDCYDEQRRPAGAPLATLGEAFEKQSRLALAESVDGQWRFWPIRMPENDASPGSGGRLTAADYGTMSLDLLRGLGSGSAGLPPEGRALLRALAGLPTTARDAARRTRIAVDFLATVVRGLLVDRIHERGSSAIAGEDWSRWLARHGGSELTRTSPLVRGMYDLLFAYDGGDTSRPNLSAAGVVPTVMKFLLGYRGAVLWQMQAGMGEVVFAPLYSVLRKRGVEFRFFHTVRSIAASADGHSVSRVVVERAAQPRGSGYDPLVELDGLPVWPDRPILERLQSTEPGSVVLRKGEDFDALVLGISLGGLPELTQDLAVRNERWKAMLEHVPTVATQAMQLWFDRNSKDLGWPRDACILGGYAHPFNTWADMSHLIGRERFAPGSVGSIAYLCGPCPDGSPAVESNARDWLARHARSLWPAAGGDLARSIRSAYFRSNAVGSERYVQSAAGSLEYRLPPDDSGFDNLFLAGDWVRTDYNIGTIEAAVLGGLSAARAAAEHSPSRKAIEA